jgi:hypothetical protein
VELLEAIEQFSPRVVASSVPAMQHTLALEHPEEALQAALSAPSPTALDRQMPDEVYFQLLPLPKPA